MFKDTEIHLPNVKVVRVMVLVTEGELSGYSLDRTTHVNIDDDSRDFNLVDVIFNDESCVPFVTVPWLTAYPSTSDKETSSWSFQVTVAVCEMSVIWHISCWSEAVTTDLSSSVTAETFCVGYYRICSDVGCGLSYALMLLVLT